MNLYYIENHIINLLKNREKSKKHIKEGYLN